MTPQPTKLALAGNLLIIDWSDGKRLRYDTTELRRHCPCATCVSERAKSPAQEPATVAGRVLIAQMNPVGNYAYDIRFSDGHATGIYPLELLRELGRDIGS